MASKTHELIFETPDRNRGQIVTYSHAQTRTGAVIDCRHDANDGSVHFTWGKSGRRLTARELARYGLIERGLSPHPAQRHRGASPRRGVFGSKRADNATQATTC